MDKIIIKLNKDVRAKVIDICNKFNNDPGELINVLHQTQDFLGYLPAEVQELIAECLHIPTAKVYGVVSFYAFFTMTPKGKYPISVCLGTARHADDYFYWWGHIQKKRHTTVQP